MTSKRSKVGSPRLDNATLNVMQKADMPVSVQYVADRIDVAWHQARAQLFKLAMEGKIKAVNTTKSWIFTINKDHPESMHVATPVAAHSHPPHASANILKEEKES